MVSQFSYFFEYSIYFQFLLFLIPECNLSVFDKDWIRFYGIFISIQLVTYIITRSGIKISLARVIVVALFVSDLILILVLTAGCKERRTNPCSALFSK